MDRFVYFAGSMEVARVCACQDVGFWCRAKLSALSEMLQESNILKFKFQVQSSQEENKKSHLLPGLQELAL